MQIVQMGKERSVVFVITDLNGGKFMIVDNSYLMQLDEMGLVQ